MGAMSERTDRRRGPPDPGSPPLRDASASTATGTPKRRRAGSAVTADRVGTIVAAAEQAAEDIRRRTEARMRDRIAEGDRAAENRVRAAEDEAAEIVKQARQEADRAKTIAASEALAIIAKAHDEADRTRDEAEQAKTAATAQALEITERARKVAQARTAQMKAQSLESLAQARIAAADVRSEGMELVNNLREMGDALRSNSERLLRDVQAIHSRMVGELDRVDGGASRLSVPSDSGAARRPRDLGVRGPTDGDELDVPEFIPPG
jgi:hypothetical protein